MSESAAQGTNGHGGDAGARVSFSDVARAHYNWDASKDLIDERARLDFEQKLELFERMSGSEVVEAYWCRRRASAVALAQLRKPPEPASWPQRTWRRLHGPEVPEFRLYRETDWLTGGFTKLADLLHECDVLAVKAIYGLEGFQQALVMQWLLRVEAHVLGYIEWRHVPGQIAEDAARAPGTQVETELDAFHRRMVRELNKIEDYYQAAGEKRARLHYVAGMIFLGMFAAALAALASAGILWLFGLLDLDSAGVRRFYACMGAGAVGAVVSVLIRMSGRGGGFTIDHELGSVGVRRLGAFRPLVGAVSGVVMSFLVQTSLVPIKTDSLTIEFYVVVAFLAGFSERWTRVVLQGAMRTVDPSDGEQKPPATEQSLKPTSP